MYFASRQMEEATPRGIIRGVLTTTSISKSARTLRPRRTPRAVNVRETPLNPPSPAEVASRLLTRSRSANRKRKAILGSATPSDSTTPRTLVITLYLRGTWRLWRVLVQVPHPAVNCIYSRNVGSPDVVTIYAVYRLEQTVKISLSSFSFAGWLCVVSLAGYCNFRWRFGLATVVCMSLTAHPGPKVSVKSG